MLNFLGWSEHAQLLGCAVLALALIIGLIAWLKLNSTLALIVASLFLGVITGMKVTDIAASFQKGAGTILGGTAILIGLGAILGKMLEESGGAEVVASRITDAFGRNLVVWAVFVIAILIGIPTFFYVGMVLIMPILFSIARNNKIPVMTLGVPLVAALSCMHALVPPHPGPMAAIAALKENGGSVDLGKTILLSLLIGIPCAMIAGPIYSRLMLSKTNFDEAEEFARREIRTSAPGSLAATRSSFLLALFTLFLPIALISMGAGAERLLAAGTPVRDWLIFFGGPLVSMLIAVLFSFYSFGTARGFSRNQILKFSNDCMASIAAMLLVVGAGGGFNKVLEDGHVGEAIKYYAAQAQLSPLVLGWGAAALIRIAAGSSTVAITAAAGIVAPVIKGRTDINLELLIVSMGAGSLILSHVNDGGFWIVKEMFGLNVSQTFKAWTIPTTIGSVMALLLALALQTVLPR